MSAKSAEETSRANYLNVESDEVQLDWILNCLDRIDFYGFLSCFVDWQRF